MTTHRIAIVALMAGVALLGAAAGTPSLFAQGTGQATGADATVSTLVAEVRALRAELTEAARHTLRSQLLVARLQLQEQRIMHLDRQRTEVSSRAADAAQRRREATATLRTMESQMGLDPTRAAGNDQQPFSRLIQGFRTEIAALEAGERELRGEEGRLLNAIAEEQARWSDFNARLDDLERVLTQR